MFNVASQLPIINLQWIGQAPYLLDGVQPVLDADFSRQHFWLGSALCAYQNIISHSSVVKYVVNSAGLLYASPANLPAYDWSTGRCRLVLEGSSTNVFLNSATGATQNITTSAVTYTLSFFGTGSITLSGTATGTLAGTGAANRVTLTFTATAGTLTATVSGSCLNVQIEAQSFASSYIPTTSSAATRTADSAQLTTAAAAYLQAAQASVVVRSQLYSPILNARLLGGVAANTLIYSPTATTVAANNGATLTATAGSGSISVANGAAYATNGTARKLALNAGTVVSDANGPGALTSIYLGNDGSSTAYGSGYYDELVVWPNYGSSAGIQAQARPWQ